ncbi:MAG: glycosyltransferase family 25 protein, partial [Alphaproteobacteria bacterium]|nr:glycosyltransferase family 25 protein [Alphaproteobacteria bacterium]
DVYKRQEARIAGATDFFPAVDGESLRGDAEVLRRVRRARYSHRRSLSYGEVGCMESHRGVWRELLRDEARDFYVVLEDDVILAPDLDEVIVSLTSGAFGVSADFVRLQVTQYVETNCVEIMPGGGGKLTLDYGPKPHGGAFGIGLLNTTGVLKNWLLGTAGYLISRAGAACLLSYAEGYTRPADVQLMRFWEHGLPPFVIYPAVVETRNAAGSELGRLVRENYAAPPFASWDPRHQVARNARTILRRRDVFRYRRFVSGLRERYGAPDHVHPPTFRYDERGLARFIPRDGADGAESPA